MNADRRRRLDASTQTKHWRPGASRFSLAYWRQRSTEEIVESLRVGKVEALKVKSDGRILNGNVRVKVLEERNFDLNSLKRELV